MEQQIDNLMIIFGIGAVVCLIIMLADLIAAVYRAIFGGDK